MDCKLKRTQFIGAGVFGVMIVGEGLSAAYKLMTLEHSYSTIDPVTSHHKFTPKIPPGVYTCVRRFSPEFKYDVFMLTDVPGHTFIEIHVGNYNNDSNGCILLGMNTIGNMITESRKAFNAFMLLQAGVSQFQLTVE